MSYATAARTPVPSRPVAPRPPADRVVAQQAGQVRLTRRGRLVVLATVVGLLLLAAVLVGARSEATTEPGAPLDTRTVVVEPGDTLWGIASEISGEGQTQATVIEIQRLNALPSVSLGAGQRIEVPLG